MEPILSTSRIAQENAGKIRTFTGRYVNPLKMTPDDICIEDIAHHLSNECRFAGACPVFYSVAQHSVEVSFRMMRRSMEPLFGLAGLLHDAAEAYLGDMSSPVKHSPEFAFYRKADDDLTWMIFEKFGLCGAMAAEVKRFDDDQFQAEVATFWGGRDLLEPLDPKTAEVEFLWLFRKYNRMLGNTRTAA